MKKFTAAPRVNFLGLLTRERDKQQLMKPSLSIRRALSMPRPRLLLCALLA